VDIIAYGDFEVETDGDGNKTFRRVLRTKPTLYYEAGDRTGRLPEVIDLNYDSFLHAYRQAVGQVKERATASPGTAGATSAPSPAKKSQSTNVNHQNR